MNAWEENIHLADQCDTAVRKCSWCAQFGHKWDDCPSYLRFLMARHTPPEPEKSDLGRAVWAVFISGAIFWIVLIWRITR